jgi:UTP:GlnB (protein PII) uridylyltransferase
MSRVAQKQDLSDPAVVGDFARIVGDERHLIALYLLTVADIRGTSPKVWNTWKGQLLEQLFTATRRCLLSSDATLMTGGAIAQRQREAMRLMRYFALPETRTKLCGSSSIRCISCVNRPRKSPGTRARCTIASTPTSRWSGRASIRSARDSK